MDRLEAIVRHIANVQENCQLFCDKCKDEDFGRLLVANSLIHDNSKFRGIEWLYLNCETKKSNPDLFAAAIKQHQLTNPHHPEYWPTIHEMPDLYVAEWCADVKARSSELGTGIWEWIEEVAADKFSFTKKDKVYKKIKQYMEMMISTL